MQQNQQLYIVINKKQKDACLYVYDAVIYASCYTLHS